MLRLLRQWTMQSNDIGLSKDIIKRAIVAISWRPVLVFGYQYRHTKDFGNFPNPFANCAIANNAQRFAFKVNEWRVEQTKATIFLPVTLDHFMMIMASRSHG